MKNLVFIPSFDGRLYLKAIKAIRLLPPDTAVTFSTRTIIDKARNIALDYCLKGDFEYLVFLDDDVIPDDDFVQKLTSHGKDMVCGIYNLRQEGNPPAVFRQELDET